MAHPKIEAFIAMAVGTAMDPDRSYGYQCVDLADYYAEFLFGVPWPQSMGGVVGAKQLLDAAPDAYWIRIDNNPNDPNLIPQRGDLGVSGGDGSNPWGHVWFVENADANGMDVIQQDGFAKPHQFVNGNWYSAKPAHRTRLSYSQAGMGTITGWLRPRLAAAPAAPAPTPTPSASALPYQRDTKVDSQVAYRSAAATNGTLISWLEPDRRYDFKGFVRGENLTIGGVTSNIWFVGRYSSGYAWAGLFTSQSTAGLDDLTVEATPEALLAPNEREVGVQPVNLRKGPGTSHGLILGLTGAEDGKLKPAHKYTFKGYVTNGQEVGGTKVWLVSKSDGYAHINGFTSQSLDGLSDLTPAPTPESPAPPAPEPAPAAVTVKDVPCVTALHPAREGHWQAGNFPAKPARIVIHQFHGKSFNVHIKSAVSWFQNPENKGFSSAHFAVEDAEVWQVVALANRAYHAGSAGNDSIGIETHVGTDEALNERTFWTVVKLIKEIADKLGYMPELVIHKSLMATDCGTDIKITEYQAAVAGPVTAPVTPPVVTPVPVPTPEPEKPSESRPEPTAQELFDWLISEYKKSRTN